MAVEIVWKRPLAQCLARRRAANGAPPSQAAGALGARIRTVYQAIEADYPA